MPVTPVECPGRCCAPISGPSARASLWFLCGVRLSLCSPMARGSSLSYERFARASRRLLLCAASICCVVAVPMAVLGGIGSGMVDLPWHLPGALAMCVVPIVSGALAVLLAALPQGGAAWLEGWLPCAAAHRGGGVLARALQVSGADMADNFLVCIASGLWACALVGPVLVVLFGTYLSQLNRSALGLVSAASLVRMGGVLVRCVLSSGLYSSADEARAVSGLAILNSVLRTTAVHTAVVLAMYHSIGGLTGDVANAARGVMGLSRRG